MPNTWEAPTTPEQRRLQSEISAASETMHDKWTARDAAIAEVEAAELALHAVKEKYFEADRNYVAACQTVSTLRKKYETS